MASTIDTLAAGALGVLISLAQSNATQIESDIGEGEAAISAGIANLLKNVPSVKGAAGLFVGPLEAAAEAAISSYVEAEIAKYTPAEVFTLALAFLQAEQKKLSA